MGTFTDLYPLKYEIGQILDTETGQYVYDYESFLTLDTTEGLITVIDSITIRPLLEIQIEVSNCLQGTYSCFKNTQVLEFEVTGAVFVPEFAPKFLMPSLEDKTFGVQSPDEVFLISYPEVIDENVESVQI